MDRENVKEIEVTECQLPMPSAEGQVRKLSEQYKGRGLAVSVQAEAEAQCAREEQTQNAYPDAYRMSSMSEGVINDRYRRGKESMDGEDLLRYVNETRQMRCKDADFSEERGVYDAAVPQEGERAVMVPGEHSLLRRAKVTCLTACQGFGGRVAELRGAWFDASRPKTGKNTRRFPVSAFAAVIAVAVSLMLIVASSVMLTRAEADVSRLKTDITSTASDVNELRSDIEAKHDLLEIRRIATEEYGMVGEDFVRMQYISVESEERIEAFAETRRASIGLSAILSALGIKK